MAKMIHVLNGPNLNLLGVREPEIYGTTTLADIEAELRTLGDSRGYAIAFGQSNHEGGLVEMIHAARGSAGVVINPAAYTHTSVAVLDALKTLDCPIIELHLSNPHAREAFRRRSYVSPVATAMVAGFGAAGYALAVGALIDRLEG